MVDIEINKFNNDLIEQQQTINIIDYVKEVNNRYYQIDIKFIDEFIELVNKDDCCIHHNLLQKYGISKLKGGTADIKKILIQNKFEENKDYTLRNVSESAPSGGCTHKIEYYLHPTSFKICLIRSKNTRVYARYYLLLEICIKYFNDYQNKLKEKYIIIYKNKIDEQKNLLIVKDDKIDKLEHKLDIIIEDNKQTNIINEKLLEYSKQTKIMNEKLLEDNKHTKIMNEKLLEYAKNSNIKLDETLEELEITNEKLDITDRTLNIVTQKLNIAVEDRVINTNKISTIEYFIVMKNINSNYKYYIIRGQDRYIKLKQEKLIGFIEIDKITCVPNATILWNLIKEQLKNLIEYCGNKLNLININENDFLYKIKEIYDKRKNVNL
jgi:hypothetical protein